MSKETRIEALIANVNGKIWAFVDKLIEVDIVGNEEKILTLHISSQSYDMDMYISLVYAKCTMGESLPLWEAIYNLLEITNSPWLVGGDFNVIHSEDEKLGGRPVTMTETTNFNHCLEVCNLMDAGFQGSKYTW